MRIHNLTKTYKTDKTNEVKALQNVSLDLPEKGMVFLLGKSGSGKTTLLNILGGLDKATSGDIFYKNNNLTSFSQSELNCYRNNVCGFVFQDYNVIPELNVEENILLALSLQGKDDRSAVCNVLKQVGLEGFEKRKVTQLSGGQKQRVAIARALIKHSEIIFADEPTGALDSETGESIFKLLKDISAGQLVVVVSHDKDFAQRYADRIIELADGKIIADTNSDYAINESDNALQLTKAKLPLKTAIDLGTYSFKMHPLRFFSTLLILILSFTTFVASFTVSETNKFAILKNTLNSGKISQVNYIKLYENGESGILDNSDGIFLEELLDTRILKLKVDELRFDFTEDKQNTVYYSNLPDSVAVIDEDILNDFGFTLSGRLPQKPNEICLPYYMAEVFVYYGKANETNQLIGKNIEINGDSFLISGLIDTGFNNERYDKLKSIQQNLNQFVTEFYNYVNYGVHSTIYVNELSLIFTEEESANKYHKLIVPANAVDFNKKALYSIQKSGYRLELTCYLNEEIEDVTLLLGNIQTAGIVISSVLGFLAVGLLIYFVVQSVQEKIHTIGILKAIGCNGYEITKIFLIECIITGLTVFIISLLLSLAACALINYFFVINFGIVVAAVSLSHIGVIILFCTTIPLSIICGICTIIKTVKINILECISAIE